MLVRQHHRRALRQTAIGLNAIDGTEARVEQLPGLITVFGGPVSSSQEREAGIAPKSLRGAFVDWVAKNQPALYQRLLIPEAFEDWKHFDLYSDLLRFEEDLSYVTSAVVVFLESPGSIAELGAFSQIEPLKERLVVVVGDHRHEKDSFISLGPLRQLDSRGLNHVCVIPNKDPQRLHEDVDLILRHIHERAASVQGRKAFIPHNRGHQFALALDFISLSEVATFSDLKTIFSHFQVEIAEPQVHQILFTLRKAGLVHFQRYGNSPYYLPKRRREKWLEYTGTADQRFNRPRVTAKISANRRLDDDRYKVHRLVFEKGGSR